MAVFFLNKPQESRKETPIEVRQKGGREEESVRLSPSLTQ